MPHDDLVWVTAGRLADLEDAERTLLGLQGSGGVLLTATEANAVRVLALDNVPTMAANPHLAGLRSCLVKCARAANQAGVQEGVQGQHCHRKER